MTKKKLEANQGVKLKREAAEGAKENPDVAEVAGAAW
jgi:hypothetical protein